MTANTETDLRPGVFLDRDGTIIEDRGDLFCPLQVEFFDETITSLQMLQGQFLLFIVTNQSGVAKGIMTLQDVERVNASVLSRLAQKGVRIVETYICPHSRADGCHCIKPNPYFLLKAKSEHNIDLCRSFVIGDHPHDVELATNAGSQGIYVLTGHGVKHREEIPPNTIVKTGIREAVQFILHKSSGCGLKVGGS